ncbi:hypothetical protein [uncultured Alistipes sp.]|uniref:hypothetical protein n=1 Tax=uncultured Alistipes sp. TaxID=538949 RepID=UPI00260C01EB|nr:hypothetical protein [uncultured Alistipes sp.]
MNSKIEARIEAVKLALNVEGVTSENIIEVSEKIADFVIGNAELPNTYDSNSYLKEIMGKVATPSPEIEKLRMEREKALTDMMTNAKHKSDEKSEPQEAEKA